MTNSRTLLLTILVLFYFTAKGQLQVALQTTKGYGPFRVDKSRLQFGMPPASHPLYQAANEIRFEAIPANLHSVEKGVIWIDFHQFLYQTLQAKKLAANIYDEFCKEWQINMAQKELSAKPIACFVGVVKGTNEAGEQMLIVDANNNGRFDDDTAMSVSAYQSDDDFLKALDKSITVSYQTVVKNKVVGRTIPLIILKQGDQYSYSFPEHATGEIKLDGKAIPFAVSHEFRFPSYDVANVLAPKMPNATPDSAVKVGQYIKLNNKIFRNDGVNFSSMTLTLSEMKGVVNGAQKGMAAIPFNAKDVLTGQNINLESYRGKYLVIDFWGTWCGPCVAQLPTFIRLYTSIDKSKVEFLGIAGRDKLESVRNLLIEKKIQWPNIVSDDINHIVDQYRIMVYPTTMLIGPDGKVIDPDVRNLNSVLKTIVSK